MKNPLLANHQRADISNRKSRKTKNRSRKFPQIALMENGVAPEAGVAEKKGDERGSQGKL